MSHKPILYHGVYCSNLCHPQNATPVVSHGSQARLSAVTMKMVAN